MAKRKAAEEAQTNKDDEELQLKEWKPERILLNSVLRLYFVLDEKQLACFDIYLSENTQHIINAPLLYAKPQFIEQRAYTQWRATLAARNVNGAHPHTTFICISV